MAASKKTSNKNTSRKSAKKPTNKTTTTRNASSSKNKKNHNSTVDALFSNKQFWAIIIFSVALFFIFLSIIKGDSESFWDKLRQLHFGIHGFSAFIFPFVLIYISIMLTLDKDSKKTISVLIESLMTLILISSAVHIINAEAPFEIWTDIKYDFSLFRETGSMLGSGFFGTFVGGLFLSIGNSKTPAIVLVFLLIFMFVMLMTGTTLIRFLSAIGKPVKKASEYSSEKIEMVKQNYVKFNPDVDLGPVPEPLSALDEITEIGIDTQQDSVDNVFDAFDSKEHSNSEDDDSLVWQDLFSDLNKKEEISEKKNELESPNAINEKQKENQDEIKYHEKQEETIKKYRLPPLTTLNLPSSGSKTQSRSDLEANADKLIHSLSSFNVEASILGIVPGPAVTRYEVAPAPGVKISRFTGLADDLALHLAAPAGVRIEAPIPNKSAIGIEIPNKGRTTVTMREILDTDAYKKNKSLLKVALGKDISGAPVCADLVKMPHLLIAGTTGSGKSVALNSMIVSLLFNATPDEVKLLLIDPKQVEFSVYNGIPHLLVPVVSDPRKAAGALGWAVTEMINRYKTLNDNGVRDIGAYNSLCEENEDLEKMPQIVIVIDELSDLMSVAPSEVEDSIMRLAQMARAAGMHLVVATQRPSVDVITGLIKANIPSRIALSVSSQIDSRTIIDAAGAEKLLGLGDMLFYPVGLPKPMRVQGCYLSDSEIEKVIKFVKMQGETSYDDEVQQEIDRQAVKEKKKGTDNSSDASNGALNDLLMSAIEVVVNNPEKASISSLQRRLGLGFAKAGRIMDELEEKGIVGPHEGSRPRKVLITSSQWLEMNALSQQSQKNEDSEDSDVENIF